MFLKAKAEQRAKALSPRSQTNAEQVWFSLTKKFIKKNAPALFNFLEMFIVWDMSRDIQSGTIILKLLKPISFRSYSFWSYLGRNVTTFFLTFLPTFIIISIVTHGAIVLGVNLIFFIVSAAMALVLNFSVDMIVSTVCLYTESTWGINIVIYANQLMRAAVPAMTNVCESILINHRSEEVEKELMPFKQIIRLIDEI